MNHVLTKRHYDALRKLREECDYEDSRSDGESIFVLCNKLSPGIGDKTISDLESWGLIEAGTNKWFRTLGYRITEQGRQEIGTFPRKKSQPKTNHKLHTRTPRIRKPKGLFEK